MSTRSWDDLQRDSERREYGRAWLPDREDDHPKTLVGVVRGYDRGPISEYSGTSPWIATIEDRGGALWSVWLNRATLTSEFERHRPMPDERIVLHYRGRADQATRPGMQPPHLYRLTVGRERELPGFLTEPQQQSFAEGNGWDSQHEEPEKRADDDDDVPF